MANISVTYSFSNGTTADATEVNTNFQDIIDGTSDGTKDFSISALTCAGTVSLNGAVNLGNATSDDITVTGRIASDLDPKTAASNTLGDATQTWQSLALDNTTTDGGAIYFDGGTTEFVKSTADGADLNIGGFTGFGLAGAAIKQFGLYSSAKSGDYTVTDTDEISVILMTTSTTARTVTLPTAADNTGRVLTIIKADSASGSLTIDVEGSETIDGDTTQILYGEFGKATIMCNGTEWFSINPIEDNYTTTLDNDFSAGTMRLSKSGNTVSMSVDSDFALANSDNNHISSALIPAGMRPRSDVSAILRLRTSATYRMSMVIITSAGQVRMDHITEDFAPVNTNTTDMSARGFTISWSRYT
jgi:hypothetical protein